MRYTSRSSAVWKAWTSRRSRSAVLCGWLRNPVPRTVRAAWTPSRKWSSARLPDSMATVRHFSSQHPEAAAPCGTVNREACSRLYSSTNSLNSSPSKRASRSKST